MRTVIGLVLALALTGCGSMSIEVSVLNPAAVEQEIDRRLLRETLPVVLSQSEVAVKQSVMDVQNEHFGFLVRLSQDYVAALPTASGDEKQVLESQALGLQQSMSNTWKPIYENTWQELLAIRTEVLELNAKLKKASAEDRNAIESRIVNALQRRNQLLADLQMLVQREVGRQLKDAASQHIKIAGETQDDAAQTLVASRKSLISGQGIVEDPYAYTVASAKDELWAPRFNRVLGRGIFGNLNMAVKMEDLGDFTLKGLTFDPSDVARVASKVTTQALLLASQIAGVPVNLATGDTTSGGEGLRVSSKRLADAESAQASEEAKIEAHEEGLMAVAATVLREWPSLESDTQRAAGIAAIKGSFAANKPRITLAEASATPPESDDAAEDDAAEDDETGDETDDAPPGLGTTAGPAL